MSLMKCIAKLSGGKNKTALAFEDKQELHRRVAENKKQGLSDIEAERAAVNELLSDAKADHKYIQDEINKVLPEKDKKTQAPDEPDNADVGKTEPPEEPAPRGERQATPTDRLTGMVQDMADRYAGATGAKAAADTSAVVKNLVGKLESVSAIVKRVSGHLPSAKKWHEALLAKEASKGSLERRIEPIAQLMGKLNTREYNAVNDYLAKSTLEQKWGHAPEGFGRKVEIDPAFASEFAKFNPTQQQLIDMVFKHNEDMYTTEQALHAKLGATGLFAQKGRLLGPYVHLDRQGNWVTVLKSKDLLEAQRRVDEDPTAANTRRLDELKKQGEHYQVHMFDTPGQAREFARDNKSRFASAESSAKTAQVADRDMMDPKTMQRLMGLIGVTEELPAGARPALEKSIRAMWLSALDRNSARQAQRERAGIAGFNKDVLRSTLNHSRAQAAHIANLEYGGDINRSFYSMKNEIKKPGAEARVGQDDFNLLAAHHLDSLEYNPTPIQDGVMAATSAWQLATSLSYHLANFSQTVMVTLPRLAADFGAGNYKESWGHVMDGYKQMAKVTNDRGMTIDLSKVTDKNLREALESAADSQLLDVGMTEDLTHFNRMHTGYKAIDGTSAVASRAIHKLRQVSSAVERWNRVSSATASYNMARAKGMDHIKAKEYMMDILRTTQGDFSHGDAPLLLKQIPKVVGQYKKFQLMMMAYYTKAFVAAFHGATAEEKAIGRRMLAFKLFHTGVASGALGLPLMNVASLISDNFFGPDAVDDKLKDLVGDGALSQMLRHGVPSALGIDMSAKLSDANIFSIMPYGDFDLTSKAGLAKTAMGLAGPAASQAGRMASGLGYIQDGELYKGTEKLMPKGLESAMQAFRLSNEGYTMKNGDVLVKPEDMESFGLFLTAMGLPSTQVRNIQEQEQTQYTVVKHFKDETRRLEHAYIQAYKDKDTAEMAELRAKWMELQRSKDDERKRFKQVPDILRHQPLSTMLSGPANQAKRQIKEQSEFKMPD